MSIIRPNWDAPENVHSISTTRLSLAAPAPEAEPSVYDYCNLGAHVGDSTESVKANRERLVAEYEIPNSPIWLEQTHSIEVAELTTAKLRETANGSSMTANGSLSAANGSLLKADGSITREHEIVCAVMTADCLPLLLCDIKGRQVSAVHAGWRGMANGVIEHAVSKFDCAPEHIIAWAGPCIGPNKFEIGREVMHQLGGLSSHYKESSKDRVLANLYAICGFKLSKIGVKNYRHSLACTYNDERQFYSYRRDGHCGRMASLIWIGDPS